MAAEYLEIAREHLRRLHEEPDPAPDPAEAVGDVLKGHAVLLVLDATGDRVWICADADDVALLRSTIAPGDMVMDRDEVRLICAIREKPVRDEVLAFKRGLPGGRFRA